MSAITWIILATFSVLFLGCETAPPTMPAQERMTASIAFNNGTDEQIEDFFDSIDDYKYDLDKRKSFIPTVMQLFGSCYTHSYDVLSFERVSEVVKKPLAYCKDVTGFSKEAWATVITPKGKEFKQWVTDECLKNKSKKEVEDSQNKKSIRCENLSKWIIDICIDIKFISYEKSLECDEYFQLVDEICF